MKSFLKNTGRLLKLTGFQPRSLLKNATRLPGYLRAYQALKAQARLSAEPFEFGTLFPILDERSKPAGSAHGHYFHQDLHVAQKIYQRQPRRHIDIGSRVDGFVAHLATFRLVEAIDVRPMTSTTANIRFLCADLMSDLPDDLVSATDSLSCLHAIEHFGLGRYGDPLQYEGHLRGLDNLRRMLQPGGTLYLSTPISHRQRIEFNAHRVFRLPYLLNLLADGFDLQSFAYVGDDGQLQTDADPHGSDGRNTFGLRYGCGIFELTARRPAVRSAA
jgi:SAM-dependent methyltransferase